MFFLIFLSGIIMFFLGIYILQTGLELASQQILPNIMYKWTKTPFSSFITGAISTMFLQSSSAVTVITLSMVNTNIISFEQSIGIILGTNIGTTFTAQILASDLENVAIVFLFLSIILIILTKQKILGISLAGLALLFIGMEYMAAAFNFIQFQPFFKKILMEINNPFQAVIVGTVLTGILQSSSVMSGIVIVLAKEGQINLLTATGLILGSNIGTCITALLAGLGTKTDAKRVAMSHILLNIIGVIIFLPIISEFSWFVAKTSTSLSRQVANTHLIFNIVCSLAIFPFIKPFSKLVRFLVR